ncbi:hypothetical protein PVAND_010093 [Polypedilum vanderplanki]|uniref:Thyroid adenoma-associated protein-like protein n=1 Tax=Polypedilum vanderplanki TaxID=319348 RepID=A0A9J6CG64_POLVA|nr:hypothetical protein PVAND_010093 [Polypedilum vanderplanki]
MATELLSISIENHWDEEYKTIFEKINHSKTMEELLKHFKELTTKIKSTWCNDKCLRKLISIYFTAKIKHPVKHSIQSFLNQVNNEDTSIEIFNEEFKKQIIHYKNLSLDEQYTFVSCLNEMSQNFNLAEKSSGLQSELLLEFLLSIVKLYIEALQKEFSPSMKNEISHRLHNSIQATIFCTKCHLSERKCYDNVKILLKSFVDICMNLLDCNEISLETKNICAILILIYNNKISQNEHHINIIQNENENALKRLCLMFGMMTVQQNLDVINYENLTNILMKIYTQNSNENIIISMTARLFVQITKKISLMKLNEFSSHLRSITKSTLSIAFLNLEYYMESVRYLAKDSLRNLIDIGTKINSTIMIDEIFKAILSTSFNTQTVVIYAIHSSIAIIDVLQRLPDFQLLILSSITTNKENKMNCYEGLSKKFQKENSFDEWYSTFIIPLIEKIKSRQFAEEEEYSLFKCLLLKCVKKNRNAIKLILVSSHEFNDIGFHLLCLSIAKMEGVLEEIVSNEETWRGVITFDQIKKYMVNIDADIRLSALQLIVDTKKSTESYTKKEIECILYFFETNINIQSPSIRQSILSMIKKIFGRLNSVVQYLLKRNECENLSNQLDMLKKFHEYCLENLAEGANYSRRSLSLNILLNVLLTMREFFPSDIENLWTSDHYITFFNIFSDAYESNKEIALEIMQYLPQSIITKYSKICFDHVKKLMSSIKPTDSLTAAFLLQFALKFDLLSNKRSTDNETSSKCPEAYRLLIWCENLLLKSLVTGEKSIIVAAGNNPMYGSLLCIRYIISKLDLCDVKSCSLWQKFFTRMISVCKRLSNVVGPIVNNSSPEGCIPNIFHEDDQNFAKIIENTTPQMVLLCAWRTIKEVSLLLGDLSVRASLNVEQMMKIGKHFIELLSNVKHRGAFEQCFFGFSQFSVALRMSDNEGLHNLPEKLLQDIILSISGECDTNENDFMHIKNLCATRRSAGLPYIIQSLLTSEIKITHTKNFHFVMQNLIKFARYGVQIETRIHSLNILRALFKCKEFNDVNGEYLCSALQTSLLGYGAQSWAERNSSTLLFSTLMIRIFGVQRNKDSEEISIKNKMCGRVFFLRYPELYEFFMAQLIEAIDYVKEQKMNSKLHPLMLLLNRLYTSITDNSESNLKLIDFIPIVAICSSCPEFQTRVLCAKFISNVIQPCHLLSRVNESIRILKDNLNLIGNSKHARILEIFYLVRNVMIDEGQIDNMIDVLNDILELLAYFKNEIICFGSLLDVIIEIFQKIWHYLPSSRIKMDMLMNCFDFNKSAYFGLPLLQSKLTVINLLRSEIDFALNINASMNSYELLEKFNCLILLLNSSNDSSSLSDLADEFEINQKMYFFAENLSSEMREELTIKTNSNKCLISELKKIAKSNDANLAARSYQILSRINVEIDGECLNELAINGIDKMPEVVEKSILKYVTMCIQQKSSFIDITSWKFLLKFIDSSSFYVKSALIDILKVLLSNLSEMKSEESVFIVVKSTILLLVDDDFEIRKNTSRTVSQLLRLREVFMGEYAQKVFLNHLLQKSSIDREKVIGMIIILMYEEEIESENEESDQIACEFQVFEKNESNNFRESFALRKLCLPILRKEVSYNKSLELFPIIQKMMTNAESLKEYQKYIGKIFS